MQSEGDEGGICVVAESCHQTSEGIGLMASTTHLDAYRYLFSLVMANNLCHT